MLAYVFWHMPRPAVARAEYERDLLAFSRALSDLNCPGVRRSTSFRISTVPWLGDPSGYEDWATIDGSYALGSLNEQAVSGGMAALHGTVANKWAWDMAGYTTTSGARWTRTWPSARSGCLDLVVSSSARFWKAYRNRGSAR